MSSLVHVVARPAADLALLSHGLILPPPSPLREGSSVSREQHLIHVLCVPSARDGSRSIHDLCIGSGNSGLQRSLRDISQTLGNEFPNISTWPGLAEPIHIEPTSFYRRKDNGHLVSDITTLVQTLFSYPNTQAVAVIHPVDEFRREGIVETDLNRPLMRDFQRVSWITQTIETKHVRPINALHTDEYSLWYNASRNR